MLGVVGPVKHIEASFGLSIIDVPRIKQRDLGGGCALDLGIYLMNLVVQIWGIEEPVEIIARGDVYSTGQYTLI